MPSNSDIGNGLRHSSYDQNVDIFVHAPCPLALNEPVKKAHDRLLTERQVRKRSHRDMMTSRKVDATTACLPARKLFKCSR